MQQEELFSRERKRERDSFGILYTGYLLSIVKIKREIEREKERERERERKVGKRERKRQYINFVTSNRFRQK